MVSKAKVGTCNVLSLHHEAAVYVVLLTRPALELLEPLFVMYSEALLFVYDHQAEILKPNVFRKDPMCANNDVDQTVGQFDDAFPLLSGRSKARQ